MAPTRTVHTAAGVALIAALMSATIAAQRLRERAYTLETPSTSALYLTSDKAVGRMALGFRALAADLYWIRALQYYGGIQRAHHEGRRSPEPGPEYASLFPFLDLATSLDPRFTIAYRFGAIFLSEGPPAGPGRADLAIQLLHKGLAARPDKWEYMQDIGFVHYWWNHDYRAAAEAFQKASEMPNAPWWLRSLAATTIAKGGDRQSSRVMWRALRESAEIEWVRNSAARSLQQLDALDAIDALQAAVDRYRASGGAIAGWRPLVRAAVVPGIPLDPTGTPYELSPEGRVTLGERSSLSPLPVEPPRSASGPPS